MSPDEAREACERLLRQEGYEPYPHRRGLWIRPWPEADVIDLDELFAKILRSPDAAAA